MRESAWEVLSFAIPGAIGLAIILAVMLTS